jgi:hypothetical protein
MKYKDNDQKIVVPPNAEIITYAAATAADLKPGKKIFVFTAKKLPDGTADAPNVSFGDYGVSIDQDAQPINQNNSDDASKRKHHKPYGASGAKLERVKWR